MAETDLDGLDVCELDELIGELMMLDPEFRYGYERAISAGGWGEDRRFGRRGYAGRRRDPRTS